MIVTVAYVLCIGIYILVSNSLWGWECTKTSMQMLYSTINLPNMNIGQLQIFIAVSGLLSLLAVVSLTVFLSSKIKNMVVCLSTALLFSILPIILYMILPKEIGIWVYSILPAAGNALQTSILYAATEFDFWNIGNIAIWLVHVMLGAYVIEIPLFTALAVYSYSRHKIS